MKAQKAGLRVVIASQLWVTEVKVGQADQKDRDQEIHGSVRNRIRGPEAGQAKQ